MLGDPPVFNVEKVVEGCRASAEAPLAGHKHEIAVTQDTVDAAVLHGDTRVGHCLQRGCQATKATGNLRVVLDVAIAFQIWPLFRSALRGSLSSPLSYHSPFL